MRREPIRTWLVIFGLGSAACTSSTPAPGAGSAEPAASRSQQAPAAASETPLPGDVLTFQAIVRLPSEQGQRGKVFRGVFLEPTEGEQKWVVSYTRDGLWESFRDKTVIVTGTRTVPEGQALMNPHLDLGTMKLAKPDDTAIFAAIGPERTMRGTFSERVWEPGTKLAGEKQLLFHEDGAASVRVVNRPEGVRIGEATQIRARSVEHSKFVAHADGPAVWVIAVER
jgi:hypothetical protein